MLNLLRAEWTKAVKHRLPLSFLVWIYPLGLAVLYAILTFFSVLVDKVEYGITAFSSGLWTTDVVRTWGVLYQFPFNVLGRMLPLAYMAVMIAGEYEWDTWKNVVPRNRRAWLVLSKIVVPTALVMLSMLATSLVVGMGQGLAHGIANRPYGPRPSGEALTAFCRDYGRQMLLGLISMLLVAAFVALSAVVARSIVGTLLAGFFFSLSEEAWLPLIGILRTMFDQPKLINLYQYTPRYCLENLHAWMIHGHGFAEVVAWGGPAEFTAEPSSLASLLVLVLWIASLTALAIVEFQTQDITC